MPNHTPIRAVRVPDDLWNAARDAAQEEGVSLSSVIVAALLAYVEKRGE